MDSKKISQSYYLKESNVALLAEIANKDGRSASNFLDRLLEEMKQKK